LDSVRDNLASLKTPPTVVLEIMHNLGDAPASIPDRIQKSFDRLA